MGEVSEKVKSYDMPLLIDKEAFKHVLAIIEGPTALTPKGFPWISESSFVRFTSKIPHLFLEGRCLLDQIYLLEQFIAEDTSSFSDEKKASYARAIKVLKNVTYTAAITAPSDLWLLRHILSTHKTLAIADDVCEKKLDVARYSAARGLNAKYLELDFRMLACRGLLIKDEAGMYTVSSASAAQEVYERLTEIPQAFSADMVESISGYLQHGQNQDLVEKFLHIVPLASRHQGWSPGWQAVEIGYRLVPLVLALRALGLCERLVAGGDFTESVDRGEIAVDFLQRAGLLDEHAKISRLGERCFARGPGPFGIIHAYHPYMARLTDILQQGRTNLRVARAANVAASQDANAKTFAAANAALDRFCSQYGFEFSVFIEHAVGQGEATRQRFETAGEQKIQYFGADLEDDAIDAAIAEQKKGALPENMRFIRHADIGRPEVVIEAIESAGFSCRGAVMIVGNGFHEVRNQSDDAMIDVFRGYQEAGILIIFTEETGLADEDLLSTAWNTYHAGFRYVHELSGQGLRPGYECESMGRMSWRKCASEAGYRILDSLTSRSRTIYPFAKKSGYNPSISESYFCVPQDLWDRLAIKADE